MPVDSGGRGSVFANKDWPCLRCFYCKVVDNCRSFVRGYKVSLESV